MLDKRLLDSVLKLNRVSDQMTEGEVAAVLNRAGWSQAEIDSALVLLRSGADKTLSEAMTEKKDPSSYRPGMEFTSDQLSELLGIDVQLDPRALQQREASPFRNIAASIIMWTAIGFLSIGLAIGAAVFSAKFFDVDLEPAIPSNVPIPELSLLSG